VVGLPQSILCAVADLVQPTESSHIRLRPGVLGLMGWLLLAHRIACNAMIFREMLECGLPTADN
jgi:hypothetical protein